MELNRLIKMIKKICEKKMADSNIYYLVYDNAVKYSTPSLNAEVFKCRSSQAPGSRKANIQSLANTLVWCIRGQKEKSKTEAKVVDMESFGKGDSCGTDKEILTTPAETDALF